MRTMKKTDSNGNTPSDKKLEIKNNQENFAKLLLLVNEQALIIKEYAAFCNIIKSLPRTNGTVTLNDSCFHAIDSYLDDDIILDAYIEKLFKEHTLQ